MFRHAFFIWLFDNKYKDSSVRLVDITPSTDPTRGFDELPANTLKAGDRAILAVAVSGDARIVNATDSDWSEQTELLARLNRRVDQLCPQHAARTARS